MKRLPPFSKQLAEARARGLVPRCFGCGHVCVALYWDQVTSAGLPRVVCPPGDAPDSFRWDFLAGLRVHIQHHQADADRIPLLVEALLADGVAAVEAVNLDLMRRGTPMEVYWPRFDREGLKDVA